MTINQNFLFVEVKKTHYCSQSIALICCGSTNAAYLRYYRLQVFERLLFDKIK